jgi:hypothetical protein
MSRPERKVSGSLSATTPVAVGQGVMLDKGWYRSRCEARGAGAVCTWPRKVRMVVCGRACRVRVLVTEVEVKRVLRGLLELVGRAVILGGDGGERNFEIACHFCCGSSGCRVVTLSRRRD